MLDYSLLEALAEVVHEGSFERAARVLHVTKSAVSQRVRLLEERVGCALVVRSQPCRATATGRQLCQHFDRVRLLETELRATLPALDPQGVSRVRIPIAVNADSLATWFAPVLTAFAAEASVLMDVAVDHEGHTAEWLRTGTVLAAVTAMAEPATGCSSRPLGEMRYRAVASPAFVARHFGKGVDADSLALAPSLLFSTKDDLQSRWVQRHCRHHVELHRHTIPSSPAFVTAALAGMGWGLHPQALIQQHIDAGTLVELVADTPLDVTLHWQQARMASTLLERLTQAVLGAASVLSR
ncbi:LysR family transcriptional regulator ArgP [Burkholderia sp. Bp9140]|uniref:LysR family transcriptional regulator ArgP n=1 Tax=Burkholderia sp. Bp9140 TaxID=2184572 RepID=UPI000F579801|nr:LysR family transcriptional regulator ArgP [Burkholderia sp. Bp9140]RQR51580.1 LysR family transcriptional regulator ArgP [Burkholderia sp. Bp9140]